jgi:cob(I)alamin adenosyltransferase
MKIYTKTGDKGETSLYGGTRVSKAAARVESYGTLDELNAFIGLAKAEISDEKVLNQLQKIQFDLFTVGSEAATPTDKMFLANGKNRLDLMISEEEITELELWMDDFDAELEPLNSLFYQAVEKQQQQFTFAERFAEEQNAHGFLNETEEVRPELIKYLNRLSDYLFVLARYISKISGEKEDFGIQVKEQNKMQGPDKNAIFPLKNYDRLCFLKNIIKNPNIIVGDYTYYDDFEDVHNFEKNVKYHFDFTGDQLIIGKFCMIASDVKFIMNGANHLSNAISTYPFAVFGNGWESAMEGKLIPIKEI